MINKQKITTAIITSFYFAIASPILAQDAEDNTQLQVLDTLSIIGSRRPVRTVTDTPAPIDVLSGESISNQGTGDISNSLRTLVPAYNVSTQPISDAATFVRPANLRGLAPDQTLILLNGKRRHRAAVISFLGNGISDGSQGVDISVIPAIALKRVEVLRDSASAQYGSDAIAGVINFVLKDSPEGGMIQTQWGQTYEGDGAQYRISANVGIPLAQRGFANISAEWREADATVRSVQRDNAQTQIDAGNTAIEQPYAQVWGQPDVADDWKIFVNSGFDINSTNKAYLFGNYAQREAEGGFFFRSPSSPGSRKGVFSTPDGTKRLVLKDNANVNCPPRSLGYLAFDANAYAAANPGCHTFNEQFPGGFRPKFRGNLTDHSITGGFKGVLPLSINYDVSHTYGENQVDFSIRDTINASFGPNSQTEFYAGSYIQTEQTFNLDLNRPLDTTIFASPLYVATGFEWRNEQFEIVAGEDKSWQAGPYADQGASIGSNGFQGFSDKAAGTWDRNSYAGYLDLEADILQDLTTHGILRVESFDDFDLNTDLKFSALYYVVEQLGFRGSVGTGFRVPTIGQQNVQNLSTGFEDGQLVDKGTVPATCPEAIATGAKNLTPEQSLTFGVGMVTDIGPVSLSVDYFNIKINDRIGKSADKTVEDAVAGVPANPCLNLVEGTKFSYYGNGFDTRTQGIDIITRVDLDMATVSPWFLGSTTELVFAGNWTQNKVTSYDANFLDNKRILQLEEALPNYRFNITLNHDQGDWSSLLRFNYFGSYTEVHVSDEDKIINASDEVTVDIEVSRLFLDRFKLAIGADNILNNFPDRNPYAGTSGSKYPESSPMGSAGGFYYFRGSYLF